MPGVSTLDGIVVKVDDLGLQRTLGATSRAPRWAAIEQAIKNVDKQTQDFAARRMDQSVRRALKGHSVDEV